MPDLDFAGLSEQARAAFRPHFDDVVRRAHRRRRNARVVGAGLVAAAVATIVAIAQGLVVGTAVPTPTPTPTPSVSRTPGPVPSYTQQGQGMQPNPSFTLIDPKQDIWDPTEADKPLTGIWSEMLAGDLDHLYLEYRDCTGSACRSMVAASADRGRTWRKLPLPYRQAGRTIFTAHGTTLIGVNYTLSREQEKALMQAGTLKKPWEYQQYYVSVDGGLTWRESTPRQVDVVPDGWPLFNWKPATITAYDPATGDMVFMQSGNDPTDDFGAFTFVPREAGIWQLRRGHLGTPSPSPGVNPWSPYLAVSLDNGVTWQRRTVPGDPSRKPMEAVAALPKLISTMDGNTWAV